MSAFSIMFIFHILLKVFAVEINDNILITNGAYFKENKFIKPYSLTTPILLKIELPDVRNIFDDFRNSSNKLKGYMKEYHHDTLAAMNDNFEHLISEYELTIFDFRQTHLKKISRRDAETVFNSVRDFFGDILSLCCRVLTHRDGKNFFENEKTLEQNFNALKDQVINDHKGLYEVNSAIKNITEKLQSQSSSLKSGMNAITKALDYFRHNFDYATRELKVVETFNHIQIFYHKDF